MKPKKNIDANKIVNMLEEMRDEYGKLKIQHVHNGNGHGAEACSHRELLLDVILSKIAE